MPDATFDFVANTLTIEEDYGDAWNVVVTLNIDYVADEWIAKFSKKKEIPFEDPKATDLDFRPHEDPKKFYVGQLAALADGWFRVARVSNDRQVTYIKGVVTGIGAS